MEIFEVESYKQGKVFGRTLFKYFVTGQEFDEDGKITKMVGEHRQVNPVSKRLARKLLENGARLDEIKRFADPDWDPGRYDDGGEDN
jgi:pilus assembly protein CpaF